MRTALIVAAGSGLLFIGLFVLTGHAWTAGAVASIAAALASTVVILRLLRDIPRPWMRRGATGLVLLSFGLIAAQWAIADLPRVAASMYDPQTKRLLAHASVRGYTLAAAGGPMLMEHYYTIPESRRPPFGVAAREYILNGPTKIMFSGRGGASGMEILPSADSELVIRSTMAFPNDPDGREDSLKVEARLILTANGGRYVIDR